MKTTTNLSNSGIKTEFIRYMKNAGAFVRPEDMTRYSYNPYLVEKLSLVYLMAGSLSGDNPIEDHFFRTPLPQPTDQTKHQYRARGTCS
jgi:hypothetical protein